MTYASAAVLPWRVAQNSKYSCVPESDFVPFDLSYIQFVSDKIGNPNDFRLISQSR
jgi:hypothetical protein